MKWIILDFGTHELKALRVSFEGPKLFVEDFASFPSKPEYFKGLGFPDAQAWTAATIGLNELDWLNSDEDQNVIAALPPAYLEARYLRFPFRNQKQIEKVLPFELESTIPFDVEEIQIRSLILEPETVTVSKKDSLVLALSYKREPIKSFEAELRKFQLSVPPVTTQNLALSSLRHAISDLPIYGILEVGHTKTNFLLMQKSGNILGTRTFWWGGHSSNPENFANFANDLRQTLKGMKNAGLQFPNPLSIFTLGMPSRAAGFYETIVDALKPELQVHLLPYPKEKLFSRQIHGLENLSDIEKALPALSIALAQLRLHRSKIPTFSETGFQFQQNIKKIKSGSFSLLRKLALLLIAPVIYGIFHMAVQNQENKYLLTNLSQILKNSGFKFGIEESTDDIVNKMKKELAASRRKIDQLHEDKQSPLVVLTQISKLIPTQLTVNVKDFKVTSSMISLTSEVATIEDANQMAAALKDKFPKLKMGAILSCTGKKDCKSFTIEIEREKSS
ncbi:MAG: hypothetical protein J0L93_11095 [Deltaproteobacteria bacterium]|nr:hypothetical protein [Deltaproteobacteria bacterium]